MVTDPIDLVTATELQIKTILNTAYPDKIGKVKRVGDYSWIVRYAKNGAETEQWKVFDGADYHPFVSGLLDFASSSLASIVTGTGGTMMTTEIRTGGNQNVIATEEIAVMGAIGDDANVFADDFVRVGDDATVLGSGAATDGWVLAADGAGGTEWSATSGGGGGIPEAPEDGTAYGRQDADWINVPRLAFNNTYGGIQTYDGNAIFNGLVVALGGSFTVATLIVNGVITVPDGVSSNQAASKGQLDTAIGDIDTLPTGGTTAQVLGKLSDADGDSGWIDQTGSGGGIPDAPTDGKRYARRDGTWVEAPNVFSPVGVTGQVGGTASDLDSLPTVDSDPQGYRIGDTAMLYPVTGLQVWKLDAGTEDSATNSYCRPTDYNGATNQKVWTRFS